MADINSNLPIFSRATTDPVIVSADTNANANSNPIFVQLADGTNDIDLVVIDSAFGATPTVMPIAGKYEATPTTYADGDATPLLVDANGRLQVDVVSGGGADIKVDDSAFTVGTDSVGVMGALADESGTDTVDEGDVGVPRMTTDRKLLIEIADATTDAQRLAIDANGAINIGDVIPGVGATNLGKAEDAVAASGDTGVMALAVRHDSATATAADGDYIPLSTDSSGNLRTTASLTIGKTDDSAFTIGTDEVIVNGYLADETTPDSVDEGDVGAARMTLDRKQLMVLADATTDSQRLAINASGEAQVDLAAVSVTAVPVSADSNANSETNPLYVYQVNTTSANEINDYDTAAAVAASATSNHDYTITNTKTMLLKSIIASASGALKVQVGIGDGTTIKATGFTSMAFPTLQLDFNPAIEQTSTGTEVIRVGRTNREASAMDVYSTIIGSEV